MAEYEFLTVQQVAQKLLVGPDAVRRWLREGQMRGYRLPGGDWRIRPEAVCAVLTLAGELSEHADQV